MGGILLSESLKYRRTSIPKLVLLAPAGLVACLTWYLLAGGHPMTWDALFRLVFQLWTLLSVPAGAALLAGLAAAHEAQAGNWYGLRVRPVSPAALYGGKLTILALATLASSLLLSVFTAISGMGIGLPEAPWSALLVAGLLSWLAALPLQALHLWVATAWGLGASVALGVPGLLAAALIGGTGLGSGVWWVVPWSWPARMALPVLGFFEGTITRLPAGFSPGVYVAVVCGMALALALFLAATSILWFGRREVI
ncbi:multidrug ABC transporter permease [Rubrobacter xylanophilus]|uniref:Multidrug ABC transporter permease n=1 Tax=Rubrobacter xylanophilus TaxID=49319 RepID=A0A510HHP2_9ACTN|nr:ABC transporter permease [Rubrobacter xylanophilus]BBL79454.1 multidrug ABC transporter permease [Rubrobacter xylanophilus]